MYGDKREGFSRLCSVNNGELLLLTHILILAHPQYHFMNFPVTGILGFSHTPGFVICFNIHKIL